MNEHPPQQHRQRSAASAFWIVALLAMVIGPFSLLFKPKDLSWQAAIGAFVAGVCLTWLTIFCIIVIIGLAGAAAA